jgi:hypothetical protein
MPKTKAEIDELKRGWALDAIFDLEETPGFEEHRAELYLFRIETELRWVTNERDLLRLAINRYRDAHTVLMQI